MSHVRRQTDGRWRLRAPLSALGDNEKTTARLVEGNFSENRDDNSSALQKTTESSCLWFRRTWREALSHIRAMTELSDTMQCLYCGHPAVPFRLGRGVK